MENNDIITEELEATPKKKKIKWILVPLTLGIIGGAVGLYKESLKPNSWQVTLDGEPVAIVQTTEEMTEDTIEEILAGVIEQLEEDEGRSIQVKETMNIEFINAKKDTWIEIDTLQEILQTSLTYLVEGYEILVDGEPKGTVDNEEIAIGILETVAKSILPDESIVELAQTDAIPVMTRASLAESPITTIQVVDFVVKEPEETTEDEELEALNELLEEIISSEDETEVIEPTEEVITEEAKETEVDEELAEEEEEDEIDADTPISQEMETLLFDGEVAGRIVYIEKEEIQDSQEVTEFLLSNTEEVIEYTLESGDTIWGVALMYNTTMEEIIALNPQIVDETKMQIGEGIQVSAPSPVLGLKTTEIATFNEKLVREIEYVENDEMYDDEEEIVQEGNDGLKEIIVRLEKLNNIEIDREVVEENILIEPTTTIIEFGTLERPEPEPEVSVSTSSNTIVSSSSSKQFMHPLNWAGSISSTYGPRWGTFHGGLDIAAPYGTPIYAADAGTVTYSGYNSGGYGNMVIIDHGNGYETYYAHNSKNQVQVGQKVSKGQYIADVGSTGYSTGNHLHFEVRYNGNRMNPYSFIY
ncbi:MAG: hypothetical protein ATN35_00315 [Epulopiscium sp. Nele67-Bin004]|nr:MAG: hypothetical protein ATN35_00315 [Epulopiscium sp. Nele67-Bin004]